MRMIDIACIIDDDSIYVFGLKKIIEMNNLCKNILVFKNGEEALKYLAPLVTTSEEFPDVILLDINMPVLDGWGFLDEFTKLKPKINKKVTLYMVSSSVNQEDIDKANKYEQVSDYIIKPINIDELKRIMA